MSNKYPKGAEWRKWDLHLHTPASYDYKGSATNEDIISTLESNGISLAAITDHHIIDVKRINELQTLGEAKGITVLPGIEFLADARGEEPIHFIGIFPEKNNLEYVWGQLKNNTNIRKVEGEGKKVNEVYCDLIKTVKLIKELGGISTIHAGDKHSSIETITNALDHTMAQKEDIANNIDFYEIGKPKDQNGYIEKVFPVIGKRLPMVLCSDNHNINNYSLKENCWIKADPTFEGLKQVLNEPADRVFIGDKPPIFSRVANNRTKYIKELRISSIDGYDGKYGKWFEDISIPFNTELVAIIGHKGSGKSAIADVISLCSNYYNNDDFSFLTSKKFREKNGKIANNFEATLGWESGYKDLKGLSDIPEATDEKGVKYLPQGQFERLTNEIATASEFQKEIEKVVFSHIDDSEKYDTHSFSELIEFKKRTQESELVGLYKEAESLNSEIIKLEGKNTKVYKTEIEKKLKKKEDELKALVEPPIVSNPNEDPEKKKQSESIVLIIDKLKENIEELEIAKESKEEEKKETLINLINLKDTKKEVELKVAEIERFISEKKEILSPFEINFDKLISLNTDFTELDKHISEQDQKLDNIKIILGEKTTEENKKSINKQIEENQNQLKGEQAKLDTEQKKYQEYLNDKKLWGKEKAKIIGTDFTPETIEYYKKEIKYLTEEIKTELDDKHEERRKTVRDIFRKKQEVIAIYKEVKSRIGEIIDENADNLKNYKIEIAASLVKQSDFNTRFFSYINHGKMGTYYSREGAEKELLKISSDINCDNEDSVVAFLDAIADSICNDKRSGQNNAERLTNEQIHDVSALYNYLFKLEFVDFNYQLKQGDKGIEQLSPGERGALLLVFYLLLDKTDIPLIIDQPEDNLDNHSVAKILVPFIRAAKKKRQIIMVTHNPNLAVVADAEQVVYVNIDKENDCLFSFIAGSIEDKVVNGKIVEVLEGAMPAFNKRKDKYYE
ncbi:PHP domain protein [bacterium BMS3Abin15]|nr:PHP domain protein [bacterium BMS3Abin15]HDZ85960.1 hypothetical protein [Candidatus Moranbacteria bacterium]